MKEPKVTVAAKVDMKELALAAQMFEGAGFRIRSKSDLIAECVRQMAILAGKSTRYTIITPDNSEYALLILKSLGYAFDTNEKVRREVKKVLEREDLEMEFDPHEKEASYALQEALMTRAKQKEREKLVNAAVAAGRVRSAEEDSAAVVPRPTPTAATPEELAAFAARGVHGLRDIESEEPTDADREAFLAGKLAQDSALLGGLDPHTRTRDARDINNGNADANDE